MQMNNQVVGLDFGGTKVEGVLFERSGLDLVPTGRSARFLVADHSSLDSMLTALQTGLGVAFADVLNFGVAAAGRVDGLRVIHPDYPGGILDFEAATAGWVAAPVTVMNDFAAEARCCVKAAVQASCIHICGGTTHPIDTTFAVVGPGTGLGHSVYYRRGRSFGAIAATEAGHSTLPLRNQLSMPLLGQLLAHETNEPDGVIVEAVLSGRGLAFLRRYFGEENVDPMAPLSEADLSPHVRREFGYLLGLQAANFVVSTGAWGGLYLSGGVLKRSPWLVVGNPAFAEGFHSVNRHREAMSKMPVWLITEPSSGAIGAALQSISEVVVL